MNADLSSHRNNAPSGQNIVEFRALGLEFGKIDKENGIIKGVSVITGGIQARGHDLEVDDVTLQQIHDLATEMGQVPVKWNHKTGADSVNGYLTNFRVAGNKLRADWHLLKSHSQYDQAIELAERMPQNVGLSTAFVAAKPEVRAGKNHARVEELIAADLVAQPAANPGGLFERQVDTTGNGKSMNTLLPNGQQQQEQQQQQRQQPQEPSLRELIESVQALTQTVAAQQEQLQELALAAHGDKGLTLEDLNRVAQLSDAELARMDLTREEVDNAVAEAMAGVDDGDPNAEPTDGAEPGADATGAAAGAPAAAPAAFNRYMAPLLTELATLRKKFTTFERTQTLEKQRAEGEQVEQLFNSIEQYVTNLEARTDALQTAFEAGGGKVSASGEFVMPAGGPNGGHGDQTEFEQLVDTAVEADKRENVSLAAKRANAIRTLQATNRKAYETHLQAKGVGATHFGQ